MAIINQVCDGNSFSQIWGNDSRQARIVAVHTVGGVKVIKMIAHDKLVVLPHEVRTKYCKLLHETSRAYIDRLKALDVPLPRFYKLLEILSFPVHVSSFHGSDCLDVIREKPQKLPSILRKIIRAMDGVLTKGNGEVGIDAILANFTLTESGRGVVYIDLFPPLINHNGKYYVHFPNPATREEVSREIQRKFEPFGILRRLRLSLISINPAWTDEFIKALDEISDPTLRSDLKQRFRTLADVNIKNKSRSERAKIVQNLPKNDVDTRRELAAHLIPEDQFRYERMKLIFASTSLVSLTPAERKAQVEKYNNIIAPFL